MENEVVANTRKDTVQAALFDLDLSSIKLHCMPRPSMISHGKRQIQQANSSLSKKIASAIKGNESLLLSKSQKEVAEENDQKASDLDHLVHLIKEKLTTATRTQKIKTLTHGISRKQPVNFESQKALLKKPDISRTKRGILNFLIKLKERLYRVPFWRQSEIPFDEEHTRELLGIKRLCQYGGETIHG